MRRTTFASVRKLRTIDAALQSYGHSGAVGEGAQDQVLDEDMRWFLHTAIFGVVRDAMAGVQRGGGGGG